MSLKTVLLLALASAMRVSDIHELSLHPSCAQFFSGDVRMILKPNPAFVPKVVGLGSPINLAAFTASPEEQWSHTLCPVRAVRTYVDRTGCFRRSNQLFLSWAGPHRGRPVTKQRLCFGLYESGFAAAWGSVGAFAAHFRPVLCAGRLCSVHGMCGFAALIWSGFCSWKEILKLFA